MVRTMVQELEATSLTQKFQNHVANTPPDRGAVTFGQAPARIATLRLSLNKEQLYAHTSTTLLF